MQACRVHFQQWDEQTLVVTVNQRLAQRLQQLWLQWCVEQGQPGIRGDGVISQHTWCAQLWQQVRIDHALPWRVMPAHELSWQWYQTVKHSEAGSGLLQVKQTAALAQAAWEQLQWWGQSLSQIPAPHGADVATFIGWAQQFEHGCIQQQVIAACQRWQYIVQQGVNVRHQHIVLVGFDQVAPVLQQWLDQLQTQGLQVTAINLPPLAQVTVSACHDGANERTQAVQWALNQVEQNRQVALIDPQLQAQRSHWQRLLSQHNVSYALSGGVPLTTQPIIHDALRLLALQQLSERDAWYELITSPFLAAAEVQLTGRQITAARLRQCLPHQVTASQVLALLEQNAQYHTLHSLWHGAPPQPDTQDAVIWLQWVQAYLAHWGWPGQRSLSSEEYQAVNKFYQVCSQLLHWPLCGQWLMRLHHVLEYTLFQPQSPKQAQISILGLLESAGQVFDAISIVGLDDTTFPSTANPNPFLPIHWQKALDMPHSSAQRELHFAQQLWTQWLGQAPLLRISYASSEGDVAQAPSRLLGEYPVEQTQTLTDNIVKSPPLTTIVDEQGLGLDDAQLAELQGGAGIFKSQSLCPFQAYARYRLQAKAPEQYPQQIDAAMRGAMLHDVLERIWQQLGQQSALLALEEMQLQAVVMRVVSQVLYHWQQRYRDLFHEVMVQLERERLCTIVCLWLSQEKLRPSFDVLAQEHTLFGYVGRIPVQLRVDRIDQLEQGMRLVIDYKSGHVSTADWTGERLADAQLPLYLQLTRADAATFAIIKPEKQFFAGISAEETGIDGINTSLQQQTFAALKQQWHEQLTQLAADFAGAVATVDPLTVKKACQYCELASLCRINAQYGEDGYE